MKNFLKKLGNSTIMCIGGVLVILGILGILTTLTIVAYEYHWFLGSIVGCFSCIVIGLFLMNIIGDGN